jgi:flagellar biosynthesis activator protein FlaF
MGLDAYRRVQKVAEAPRASEYRLFGQVTAALIKARDQGLSGAQLVDSLDWNRRLWSTLSSDCADPANGMPQALRAQIMSLALWVSRYSSDVAAQGASVEPLIDVNKAIMEGLDQRAQPQPGSASTA